MDASRPPTPPDRGSRRTRLRSWLARHALGLWFFGIAALGLVRWWMKAGREGADAAAPDVVAWLLGALSMAALGGVSLWRSR